MFPFKQKRLHHRNKNLSNILFPNLINESFYNLCSGPSIFMQSVLPILKNIYLTLSVFIMPTEDIYLAFRSFFLR